MEGLQFIWVWKRDPETKAGVLGQLPRSLRFTGASHFAGLFALPPIGPKTNMEVALGVGKAQPEGSRSPFGLPCLSRTHSSAPKEPRWPKKGTGTFAWTQPALIQIITSVKLVANSNCSVPNVKNKYPIMKLVADSNFSVPTMKSKHPIMKLGCKIEFQRPTIPPTKCFIVAPHFMVSIQTDALMKLENPNFRVPFPPTSLPGGILQQRHQRLWCRRPVAARPRALGRHGRQAFELGGASELQVGAGIWEVDVAQGSLLLTTPR